MSDVYEHWNKDKYINESSEINSKMKMRTSKFRYLCMSVPGSAAAVSFSSS